jgi:hypothetical protein
MSLTQFAPGLYKYLYQVCKFCWVTVPLLNNCMKRLLHALWILTMIVIAYTLVGCSTINSTVENGIGNIPGQRVHVSTTVYRW